MLLIHSPDAVFRRLGAEVFLCHLKTNRMFELNETGARIWELAGAGRSGEQILVSLTREFAGDVQSMAEDVERLIESLLAEGLLVQVRPELLSRDSARTGHPFPPSAWVLRWEIGQESLPELVSLGSTPSVSGFLGPTGDFVAFDGYLFDPGERGTPCAQRLAEGFARRGPAIVDELRGAFTAAVWERPRRRLIVMRDAMGIRPCYYHFDGRTLVLSTSVEALLSQFDVPSALNEIRLAEYVYRVTCSAQSTETYFRDIRRVPPAHCLFVDREGVRLQRYWDPVPPGFEWADDTETRSLESALERAVARCLSVGANALALSGGFDSIGIACLASRLSRSAGVPPPVAISLRFDGVGVDESATQRAVAAALGMRQRLSAFPECDPQDLVVRGLIHSATSPGPVLSPWQWMYESLLCGSNELRAGRMMLGSGGDEMFNVDASYAADLLARLDLRGLFGFLRAWQRTSPLSGAHVCRYIVWTYGLRSLVSHTLRSRWAIDGKLPPGWMRRMRRLGAAPLLIERVQERVRRSSMPSPPGGETWYVHSLRGLSQSPILMDELEQGAAWADVARVELLYPYLDRDLVQLALRLRPESLYGGGHMKTPLRDLVARNLRSLLIPRRKVDFTCHANRLLRSGGPRAWRKLRDLGQLTKCGIVNPAAAQSFVDGYFAGAQSEQFWTAWAILGSEDWIRQHT